MCYLHFYVIHFGIFSHRLATKIESCWRGAQARKERERRAWAVKVIKKLVILVSNINTFTRCITFHLRDEMAFPLWHDVCPCRFIKGYMTRRDAKTTDNSEYLAFVRQSYLNRLRDKLPKTVLDKTTWLTPPPVMTEVFTNTRLLRSEEPNGSTAPKSVWTLKARQVYLYSTKSKCHTQWKFRVNYIKIIKNSIKRNLKKYKNKKG